MAKHGWHAFLIETEKGTSGNGVSTQSQFNLMTSASQFSNRGTNENKRATLFFNLRENTAGGLESLLESQSAAMSVIVENTSSDIMTNSYRQH